jgi:hypothetical protein
MLDSDEVFDGGSEKGSPIILPLILYYIAANVVEGSTCSAGGGDVCGVRCGSLPRPVAEGIWRRRGSGGRCRELGWQWCSRRPSR